MGWPPALRTKTHDVEAATCASRFCVFASMSRVYWSGIIHWRSQGEQWLNFVKNHVESRLLMTIINFLLHNQGSTCVTRWVKDKCKRGWLNPAQEPISFVSWSHHAQKMSSTVSPKRLTTFCRMLFWYWCNDGLFPTASESFSNFSIQQLTIFWKAVVTCSD